MFLDRQNFFSCLLACVYSVWIVLDTPESCLLLVASALESESGENDTL